MKKSVFSKSGRRQSQSGHGLMLLMAFLSTAVLTVVSLQMMQVNIGFSGNNSADNRTTAENIANSAVYLAQADILTKLDNGTFDPATYSYSGNVSVPNDPTNLAGASTVAGTYTATILNYNGNTYLVKIVATAGNSTTEAYMPIEVAPSPNIPAQVEAAILAGSVASISNADLITYAQSGYAKKTATAPSTSGILATPAGASPANNCTTTDGSQTKTLSGTLNYGSITNRCGLELYQGTYTGVNVNTISNTTAEPPGNRESYIWIDQPSVASMAINIGTMDSSSFWVEGANNTAFTVNIKTLQNTNAAAHWDNDPDPAIWANYALAEIDTGKMGDTVKVDSGCVGKCYFYLGGGADTFVLNGAADGDGWLDADDDAATDGNDTLYIKSMANWFGLATYRGDDQIYFQSGAQFSLYGGAGNDIIACTNAFGAACTLTGSDPYIYGEAGNDIISLDAVLNLNWSEIYGGTGNNILYIKGTQANAMIRANDNVAGAGNSVVILDGNTNGGEVRAYGSNNVLLKKSGITTTGTTITGFARTITY